MSHISIFFILYYFYIPCCFPHVLLQNNIFQIIKITKNLTYLLSTVFWEVATFFFFFFFPSAKKPYFGKNWPLKGLETKYSKTFKHALFLHKFKFFSVVMHVVHQWFKKKTKRRQKLFGIRCSETVACRTWCQRSQPWWRWTTLGTSACWRVGIQYEVFKLFSPKFSTVRSSVGCLYIPMCRSALCSFQTI